MTPEELDHTPLGKGKYRDSTPSVLAIDDPDYLVWAYENWSPKPCSKMLYESCRRDEDDDWISDADDTPKFR